MRWEHVWYVRDAAKEPARLEQDGSGLDVKSRRQKGDGGRHGQGLTGHWKDAGPRGAPNGGMAAMLRTACRQQGWKQRNPLGGSCHEYRQDPEVAMTRVVAVRLRGSQMLNRFSR